MDLKVVKGRLGVWGMGLLSMYTRFILFTIGHE
jgi:hypothetical protein